MRTVSLVLLDDGSVHISEASASTLFESVDCDVARGKETQVKHDVLFEKCDHACCVRLAALWLIMIVRVSFFSAGPGSRLYCLSN